MSTPRKLRLTRRSAARALDHSGSSGVADLDRVLSNASAPATASELGREADAVAMFQAARLSPVPISGRQNMVQTTLSKLAAAKVIVAGAAALTLATGGVALAASTGHLSNPLGAAHRSPVGAAHAATPHATPTDGESTEAPGTPSASPAATPSPSFKGLCHAFQAGATDNTGKALSNPAFTALSNAAGGAENIATYCITLIGTPSEHPTQAATPTHPAHPTQAATPTRPAHPTQAATPTRPAHPTQAATPTRPAHPNANRPTALSTPATGQAGS